MNRFGMTIGFCLLCIVFAGVANGQTKPQDKKEDPLAAFAKFADPGPEHKALEPMNGRWTFTGKMWMDPAQPPTDSKGMVERKWMLGGRFLADDLKTELFGQPFTGFGMTGYDRMGKKYNSLWTDSLSTSMSIGTGTYDEKSKTFTFVREDMDPATMKKVKGKDVIKIDSNDQHTMTMYKEGTDGKEMKVMEIIFTRVKK